MCAHQPSPEEPTAFRPPEETPTVVVDEQARRALQFAPGAILGERYRIVSLIGSGGMGEVYRADDLKLGQTVALKFLSRHGSAPRLLDEVRIGRQISHPNVCRLYDIAEADGHLFITMEFVDGEDLASLLRRVGRLSPEKAPAVAREICAGVAAAHEKGVIHRDLKPANVMIDGRGRARVTDFGLAVAGAHANDSAGTPAYMAPEQLAGEPASIASDIYALGLVLYEIFTGRRPFPPASNRDLLMRQRACDFTRPSVVTQDVPAAMERLIVRCLDPDPRARPSTVEEIVRELPGGGDALALAVAAGETPSPAMVAAASKSGDLSPLAAWSLFAIAIAGLAFSAFNSNRLLSYATPGAKAPEVLQERAREILTDAGSTGRPGDSDLFVTREGDRLIATYRQSRLGMRPRAGDGVLTANDPPLDPGMANVVLDAAGSLLRFTIVPPAIDRSAAGVVPKWDRFITAAGYDPRLLHAATPERSAPVDSDSKAAWRTKDGGRIEAAAYHGSPVWFSVVSTNGDAAVRTAQRRTMADRLAYAMFVIFMISIPAAALVLARAHLRRKQSDRAGAWRAATAFGIATFIALMFHAHHPMNFIAEWIITSWQIAQATFWALMTAVFYIALEPIVRKRWPQILISWTRLLAGRVSDPMVGRDVLMGAAAAALTSLAWYVTLMVSQTWSLGPSVALGPPRYVVYVLAWTFSEALFRGFGLVILLILLRAVVRNDIVASLLTVVLVAMLTIGDAAGPFALRAVYGITASWVGVILARHFGLLAVISYAFFVVIQYRLPFTLDSEVWYFGRSTIVLVLFALIVAYAFRTSLGVKRWLPRLAFEA